MKFSVVLAVLGATAVAANAIPPCVSKCLKEALKDVKCAEGNLQCYCKDANYELIQKHGKPCVMHECGEKKGAGAYILPSGMY